jgi:diaminopimelate epimerase
LYIIFLYDIIEFNSGLPMHYIKYHGLGNDYLVMNASEIGRNLTRQEIIALCHRNYGIGSDGILWGTISDSSDFYLRIFNPDGSEAEKSGNGLRIFSRYLWDQKRVKTGQSFQIHTAGGPVQAKVTDSGRKVQVEMGKVSFNSKEIPVKGPDREVIDERISVDGREYRYCAATIGNPHCVVLSDEISPLLAQTIGPKIETDSRFPNRTNVQFLKVLNRNAIQIEIWERGAGYTLASGSSSSAAAAVAFRLGLCDPDIIVHMPGGTLSIQIHPDFTVRMTGPVSRIGEGHSDPELFKSIPTALTL